MATSNPGENWTVANIAVTGAMLGALVGGLWRRPHLWAGLGAGLLAGGLVQVIINAGGWNTDAMPGLAFVFGLRVLPRSPPANWRDGAA